MALTLPAHSRLISKCSSHRVYAREGQAELILPTLLYHCFHLFPCVLQVPLMIHVPLSTWKCGEHRVIPLGIQGNRPVDEIHWQIVNLYYCSLDLQSQDTHTIEIICAEISERLVKAFLNARVPGSPDFAGDL